MSPPICLEIIRFVKPTQKVERLPTDLFRFSFSFNIESDKDSYLFKEHFDPIVTSLQQGLVQEKKDSMNLRLENTKLKNLLKKLKQHGAELERILQQKEDQMRKDCNFILKQEKELVRVVDLNDKLVHSTQSTRSVPPGRSTKPNSQVNSKRIIPKRS